MKIAKTAKNVGKITSTPSRIGTIRRACRSASSIYCCCALSFVSSLPEASPLSTRLPCGSNRQRHICATRIAETTMRSTALEWRPNYCVFALTRSLCGVFSASGRKAQAGRPLFCFQKLQHGTRFPWPTSHVACKCSLRQRFAWPSDRCICCCDFPCDEFIYSFDVTLGAFSREDLAGRCKGSTGCQLVHRFSGSAPNSMRVE